ncbi:MAG: hypothetical protein R3250_04120 [Melioribacteraceae bacterium]|nr:hypothetical protein [Melioribacteraceae bacterium]
MTEEKKDLTEDDLLKLGIYEDTGQANQDDEAILRLSFPTLVGKMTVKNEILNLIQTRIDDLKKSRGVLMARTPEDEKKELNKIDNSIEALALLHNYLVKFYKELDSELRNRRSEYFDGDIESGNIIIPGEKTFH